MSAWPKVPLIDTGTWYGGGTPSKSRPEFWRNGEIPWLSPKDMGADVLDGTLDHITVKAVLGSAVRLVPANSVAIVVRSGILQRTLPVARVPFATTLNQDMKALRTRDDIDPRWIALGIRAFETEILSTTRKAGTTVASIETAKLQAFELPVPPLDEQRRIVEILEGHLSRLDAARTYMDTATARSARMLTTTTWHHTHGLPNSARVRLDAVAEVRLGRQRSPKNHTGDRMRPYLRAANVDWDSFRLEDVKEMNFTESEEATYRLEFGDILLTEASGSAAEVGKSVVYRGSPEDVCFQNTLLRVRCHEADADFVQKYLLAEAMAGRFRPESRGVGINHLGRARLAALEIELPPLAAQNAAARRVEELTARIASLRGAVAAAELRAESLRRSLLAAAFSGRLTGSASDIDRVEEAASEVGA